MSERVKVKEFLIKDLARIIKAEPSGEIAGLFTGVSTDSRTVKAGDCFFAIAGDNFDGHNYVSEAFGKGAACAVVKSGRAGEFGGRCLLEVDDTVKALGRFACWYRRHSGFKVVAITGSVGKTTTRQITYHVLSRHFRVSAAPKNFNNNIGLPMTLLGAESEDEIVIAELGSNHAGEITYLTRIAEPDIAVVTNVYPAHLAGFGNIETIVREKLSISEGLRDGGDFIINGDFDQLTAECRARELEFITFGKSSRCDIQAQSITCNGFGSSFTIDDTAITMPLPGEGNVENALAAWSICSRFGISINDFASAIKTLPAVPMRVEPLQIGTLTVLSDCYNANPASMKNALDILAGLNLAENRRRVFICGSMAELGQQAELLHAELGAYIARARVQLLLCVGKFAEIAAEAAKKDAEYDLQTKCFKDAQSVSNNLGKFVKDSDIILVKGSRDAKLETAVDRLKELFS